MGQGVLSYPLYRCVHQGIEKLITLVKITISMWQNWDSNPGSLAPQSERKSIKRSLLRYNIYNIKLSIFTELYHHHHCSNIFIASNPVTLVPISLSAQFPGTRNLPSSSMDLPILNIVYKWNHTTCNLCAWFLSFNMVFSKFTKLGHVFKYNLLYNQMIF